MQKRTFKSARRQLGRKALSQVIQARKGVIVTHSTADCFPNVFLWIEIWRSYWKEHEFQARIGSQKRAECRATMPRSAVPKQQDATVGKSIKDDLQMARTCLSIHDRLTSRDHVAGMKIESAEEVRLAATRVSAYDRRQSARCPDALCRGLQIERSFILGQNHRVRRFLQQVDQFFSSCSSKSAICVSRRDLKTLAGRWKLNPQAANNS